MNPSEAMRRMIETSGKSGRQVAREIGRSDTFISASLAQGVCPRMDTFARVAHVCGYEVIVVPTGTADPDSPRATITIECGDGNKRGAAK